MTCTSEASSGVASITVNDEGKLVTLELYIYCTFKSIKYVKYVAI